MDSYKENDVKRINSIDKIRTFDYDKDIICMTKINLFFDIERYVFFVHILRFTFIKEMNRVSRDI